MIQISTYKLLRGEARKRLVDVLHRPRSGLTALGRLEVSVVGKVEEVERGVIEAERHPGLLVVEAAEVGHRHPGFPLPQRRREAVA